MKKNNWRTNKINFKKRIFALGAMIAFVALFIGIAVATDSFAKASLGASLCTILVAGTTHEGEVVKAGIKHSKEDDEQFDTRKAKEDLLAQFKSMIDSAVDIKMASVRDKDELKTLKDFQTKIEAIKEISELSQFKTNLEDLKLELKAVKEAAIKTGNSKDLKTELKANLVAIKKLARKESAEDVVLKAVVTRADIANNQQAVDLPNIGQLATRKLSLYDLFPKIQIGDGNNNGTIRYYDWDEATIVRAAAAVAEGVAFDESTAKFKKGSVVIEKIGDTLPVTEEFFEDEVMFASELQMFLDINVQLEMDRQLWEGDGTGNQIIGLKESIPAYTLPGAGSVVDASIYDLIVKLAEAITTTGGSKYFPNFAVMNISDINRMRLKKDDNFNYIMPPFVSRDGNQVASLVIVESNIVPANEMAVGDSRFAKIYEKAGVVLSKGLSGTQFVEDEMTLKARKRMCFLIRSADEGGFLYVADIDAALAAINIV